MRGETRWLSIRTQHYDPNFVFALAPNCRETLKQAMTEKGKNCAPCCCDAVRLAVRGVGAALPLDAAV